MILATNRSNYINVLTHIVILLCMHVFVIAPLDWGAMPCLDCNWWWVGLRRSDEIFFLKFLRSWAYPLMTLFVSVMGSENRDPFHGGNQMNDSFGFLFWGKSSSFLNPICDARGIGSAHDLGSEAPVRSFWCFGASGGVAGVYVCRSGQGDETSSNWWHGGLYVGGLGNRMIKNGRLLQDVARRVRTNPTSQLSTVLGPHLNETHSCSWRSCWMPRRSSWTVRRALGPRWICSESPTPWASAWRSRSRSRKGRVARLGWKGRGFGSKLVKHGVKGILKSRWFQLKKCFQAERFVFLFCDIGMFADPPKLWWWAMLL